MRTIIILDSYNGSTVADSTADINWNAHALTTLKRAGHRPGGARTAVIDQLGEQDCCLSAQAIFDELRKQGGGVGLASVYRSLELLTALKLVHRIDIDSVAHYEPADPGGEHHHHVVCDRCGAVSAFEDSPLELALDRLVGRLKHDVSGHDVVLHGTCPKCK